MEYSDFDKQVKYTFKKEYTTSYGTIPQGTEIIVLRGLVYVNGGMADEYSRSLIMNIINNPKRRDEYLVRTRIIGNKV